MKKREQNLQQKKTSLIESIFIWVKGLSIRTKIILISFVILILGFVIINNSNNSELIKVLEESKKRTEEKLKSISLYEDKLDKNKTSIKKIEEKIHNTESKIEEITEEEPKPTSLDKFFDERVR